MKSWLDTYIKSQISLLEALDLEEIEHLIGIFREVIDADKQIFIFGNGGSAANASHFVTDLGKGAMDSLGRRIRCLSLNDNSPWMTALGNDYSYGEIFGRQLANFGDPGDLAMCMSVSGNSENITNGLKECRKLGLKTALLTGESRDCKAAVHADHILCIPSLHFGRVEDLHMTLCHIIAYYFIEEAERTGDNGKQA